MKYLTILIFLLFSFKVYGQARSGVGFAIDFNKPFSNNDYHIGGGGDIQGSIALGDKWAIVPAIGVET